jgi:hypothetical protein
VYHCCVFCERHTVQCRRVCGDDDAFVVVEVVVVFVVTLYYATFLVQRSKLFVFPPLDNRRRTRRSSSSHAVGAIICEVLNISLETQPTNSCNPVCVCSSPSNLTTLLRISRRIYRTDAVGAFIDTHDNIFQNISLLSKYS